MHLRFIVLFRFCPEFPVEAPRPLVAVPGHNPELKVVAQALDQIRNTTERATGLEAGG